MAEALETWFAKTIQYDQRPPQAAWHFPVHLAICFISTALPLGKKIRLFLILPVVLYNTLIQITYTTGAVKDDYFNALRFLIFTLTFVDHLIIGPTIKGEEARYIRSSPPSPPSPPQQNGTHDKIKPKASHHDGQALSECNTFRERLIWTTRLFTTWRGMGWNWQINKLPANPDVHLLRGQAALRHLRRLAKYYIRHAMCLYIMTFTQTLLARQWGDDTNWRWQKLALDILLIWSAQLWMIDSSKFMHHMLATLTLTTNLCSPSDWPPLWGKISNAWSVRQVWGEAYHQFFRRTFEVYSNLFASALGLRKGSFASRYTKLYASFFVSTLIHWWFSFCGAADEQGNFRYFMSQAVIISFEDFVRWAWRGATGRKESDALTRFEKIFGHVWTFCWFTYSMPIQVFFEMGTIEPLPIELDLRDLGRRHALMLIQRGGVW
jgi:hypothetical protein